MMKKNEIGGNNGKREVLMPPVLVFYMLSVWVLRINNFIISSYYPKIFPIFGN